MMIRLRRWLFLCLLGLALPSPIQPARAEDGRSGYYVALTGLLVIPRDSEWTEHLLDAPVTFDLPTKNGFGVLGVLGYSLASRLRGEGEIGYRGFHLDESGGVRIDGRFDTLSFMINGFYDFEAGPVRPYVGGGIGLAWNRIGRRSNDAGRRTGRAVRARCGRQNLSGLPGHVGRWLPHDRTGSTSIWATAISARPRPISATPT